MTSFQHWAFQLFFENEKWWFLDENNEKIGPFESEQEASHLRDSHVYQYYQDRFSC